ncbi:cytochrome P450 [Trichoderma novae-zelandiae]
MDRVACQHTKIKPNLPYINTSIEEMLRWFTVIPVDVAHENDEEIIFRGYRVLKGSTTVANNWWFLHDPKAYLNPMAFDADRFLAPRNKPEVAGMFGYGRRLCPGRFFALEILFTNVSQTLAVCTISRAVDVDVVLKTCTRFE